MWFGFILTFFPRYLFLWYFSSIFHNQTLTQEFRKNSLKIFNLSYAYPFLYFFEYKYVYSSRNSKIYYFKILFLISFNGKKKREFLFQSFSTSTSFYAVIWWDVENINRNHEYSHNSFSDFQL